jgi:hypothetical protein
LPIKTPEDGHKKVTEDSKLNEGWNSDKEKTVSSLEEIVAHCNDYQGFFKEATG